MLKLALTISTLVFATSALAVTQEDMNDIERTSEAQEQAAAQARADAADSRYAAMVAPIFIKHTGYTVATLPQHTGTFSDETIYIELTDGEKCRIESDGVSEYNEKTGAARAHYAFDCEMNGQATHNFGEWIGDKMPDDSPKKAAKKSAHIRKTKKK